MTWTLLPVVSHPQPQCVFLASVLIREKSMECFSDKGWSWACCFSALSVLAFTLMHEHKRARGIAGSGLQSQLLPRDLTLLLSPLCLWAACLSCGFHVNTWVLARLSEAPLTSSGSLSLQAHTQPPLGSFTIRPSHSRDSPTPADEGSKEHTQNESPER